MNRLIVGFVLGMSASIRGPIPCFTCLIPPDSAREHNFVATDHGRHGIRKQTMDSLSFCTAARNTTVCTQMDVSMFFMC